VRASIVVVGNELLAGHTEDANGPFLARRLREHGHQTVRIAIVSDDEATIVDALQRAAGEAELVFVCGGLGPTQDDVTADAVAKFLHRPLDTPEEAKEQIRRIYRKGKEEGYLDSAKVDEDAWRMARVPKGGTVIRNDAGAAPGSVHTIGAGAPGEAVYVLPGPPAELQSVFEHVERRDLLPEGDTLASREVHLATFEAPVSRELEAFDAGHDDVDVGSYPQHDEQRVVVRLTGPPEAVAQAQRDLEDRFEDLVIRDKTDDPPET
jgi:molybdenum cofactor synthesis domain-containing protein